jgi:hypothetical protein
MNFERYLARDLEDVPLDDLNRAKPMVAPATQPDAGHRERMEELIQRPSAPAPFPEDLPIRPIKYLSRRWIIVTVVLACLLTGFIASTTVLGVRLSQAPLATVTPSPVTMTAGPTPSTITRTLRETQTAIRTVVEICNHDKPDENWFISAHYCVLVDCKDGAQADFWQNDCKNFCRDQTFCGNTPNTMSSRMKDCCSHCECDKPSHKS